MNSKLLIIVITGLTAIGSLFLFSKNQPELEPQTANIIQTVATPAPSKTAPPKIKPPPAQLQDGPVQQDRPVVGPSPFPSFTPFPTKTPTPTPNLATPLLSTSPTPTLTPIPTPNPTPEQTSAPTPSGSSQHTFYTSSHWKAKYYYCDTDNGWKDLSPTYLKSFSAEAELLATYSRVLHEPCKD